MKRPILSLSDLTVSRGGTTLLHKLSFAIPKGEIHMIMGPNGSGKSTLLNTIMGHPACTVDSGTVFFARKNIAHLSPSARARLGIMLAFQNPVALSGVPFAHVVQAAREATASRFPKLEQHLSPGLLADRMKNAMKQVGLDAQFLYRSLNDGWSGGEKKKAELVQLLLLQPKLALIDEIDSGLDVDALRAACTVLKKMHATGTTVCIVTHNPRLVSFIRPNRVHILQRGTFIQSGTASLAKRIELHGYDVAT